MIKILITKKAEEKNMPEEVVAEAFFLKVQPNKKFIDILNIANLVVCLCSENANGITGAALSVDGGWTGK